MKRNLTCIVCPMGCSLEVELENGKVSVVSGNTCPRGKEYAISECTNPVRTVTSTVRAKDGQMISVKSDKPIPRDKVLECMKIINSQNPDLPIKAGCVIIKDIFGCNIIATQNSR